MFLNFRVFFRVAWGLGGLELVEEFQGLGVYATPEIRLNYLGQDPRTKVVFQPQTPGSMPLNREDLGLKAPPI